MFFYVGRFIAMIWLPKFWKKHVFHMFLVYKFRVMKYEKRAKGWPFQDKFYFVCQTFCCKNMTSLILGQFWKKAFSRISSCTLWPEMNMSWGKQLKCKCVGWCGGGDQHVWDGQDEKILVFLEGFSIITKSCHTFLSHAAPCWPCRTLLWPCRTLLSHATPY